MKTQNPTQTTSVIRQPITPFTPDLSHRFIHLFKDYRDISDSIHLMVDRASGILDLLATQFEQEDSNTLCNESIYLAIASASMELQDIKAYLKAFSDSQKQ